MDLKNKNKSKQEVADELKYLLELVRDIESNDKSHAVQTLVGRKSSLMNLEEVEEAEATEETAVEEAEATEETAVEEAEAAEPTEEEIAA